MLEQISQELVTLSSKLMHQSVLITDTNGIVIGCSDLSRIGNLHEASMEVIRSRRSIFHDESMAKMLAGTFAGITLPVELGNEVVGTVGITGDPNEVSQYGLLIKMFVEVLLKDRLGQHLSAMREQETLTLVREILNSSGDTDDVRLILSHGYSLGYELNTSRIAIFLEVSEGQGTAPSALSIQLNHNAISMMKAAFGGAQDICVSVSPSCVLAFASPEVSVSEQNAVAGMKEKCDGLRKRLENIGSSVNIGIGRLARSMTELRQSYEDAYQSMRIGKKLHAGSAILYYKDVALERLIASTSPTSYQQSLGEYVRLLLQQKDCDEIFRVITAWCECRFNISETAQRLFIHKNTLAYRLDRIKKLCGLDPREFRDALTLYLAVTLHCLSDEEGERLMF